MLVCFFGVYSTVGFFETLSTVLFQIFSTCFQFCLKKKVNEGCLVNTPQNKAKEKFHKATWIIVSSVLYFATVYFPMLHAEHYKTEHRKIEHERFILQC